LTGIKLNSKRTYSFYAIYNTADSGFTNAKSKSIDDYQINQVTPQQDVNYTLTTPNGDNQWYINDGVFEITPKGCFDKIKIVGNDGWVDKLTFAAETNEVQVTFVLYDSETEEISNSKTVSYKIDKTTPTDICVVVHNLDEGK